MTLKERLSYIRDKLLDFYILLSSILMLLLALAMLFYCFYVLEIADPKPYFLYILLIVLSIWGLKYYKKEVEL